MKRKMTAALAAMLLLAASACVSSQVPEEGDYRHRYYAAVADYTLAKMAAERYVQLPSTSLSEAEAILEVMETADERLREFETLRREGELAEPQGYVAAASVLKSAAAELRRLRREEG